MSVLPPANANDSLPPQRLGPYHILSVLGEGGMGTVYLAEQHEPVRRRVALKVIKLGMDSKAVLQRFELERQALAVMNHDGIARVFDCGTTERGQPFFAMEYVKGTPLDDYCDRNKLALPERIGLFQQVCSAVQHAHQKGVIHRDLKPGNILVSEEQGQPVPKVIDFGLARATDHMLLQQSMFTELGMVVGTPEYMSPEQADPTSADIDTRTDIYSLGIVLYELLTGTVPFPRQRLQQAGMHELQRLIREAEPQKPSTRVSGRDAATTEALALQRRTTARALGKALEQDLDWIVLRAIAKDRNRRYESAAGLALDLGRYLAHEPVTAGPPSAGYRLKKILRRYRGQVVAGAAVFVTAVAGAVIAIAYAVEADQQSQLASRSEANAKDNLDLALAAVDKALQRTARSRLVDVPGTALLRKQLLEDALAIHQQLARGESGAVRAREERARSRRRVGEIRLELGETRAAIDVLLPAIAELRTLLPQSRRPLVLQRELALALDQLAEAHSRLGQVPAQLEDTDQALVELRALMARLPQDRDIRSDLQAAQIRRISVLNELGQRDTALAELDQLEATADGGKVAPSETKEQAERRLIDWCRLAELRAVVQTQKGDLQAAGAAFRLAAARLATAQQLLPDNVELRRAQASVQENLAHRANQQRDYEQVEPLLSAAIDSYERLVADEPEVPRWRAHLSALLGERAVARFNLDATTAVAADFDRGVQLIQQLVQQNPDEPSHRRCLGIALGERANWHAQLDDLAKAQQDIDASIAAFDAVLAGHPDNQLATDNLVSTLGNAASIYARLLDNAGAQAHIDRAIGLHAAHAFGDADRTTIELHVLAADVAVHAGDQPGCRQHIDLAMALTKAWLARAPDDPQRLSTLAMVGTNLGSMLLPGEQYQAAIAMWNETLPAARAAAANGSSANNRLLAMLLLRLADVYLRMGEIDAAKPWFAAAIAETGATKARLKGYETLQALFDRPEFQDLLPAAAKK